MQMDLNNLSKWNDTEEIEKQRRIAWSVATSTAVTTREDPVMIYNKIMKDFQTLNKTNESQNSGNA